MQDIHRAKTKVLAAADRWAREVLREKDELSNIEQSLLDAVVAYNKAIREQVPFVSQDDGALIPPPPHAPKFNRILKNKPYKPCTSESSSRRFSKMPTIPAKAKLSTIPATPESKKDEEA